jgi:site-specific recombinase XerC
MRSLLKSGDASSVTGARSVTAGPSQSLSSPVAGTILDNTLEREKPSALSANLSRQAWQALRDAANALSAIANAALGESSAPSSNVLSLPVRSAGSDVPGRAGVTVIQTVNDFLRAKARAGRSDRYLRALRVSLTSFTKGRAHDDLASVTVSDIEGWLDDHTWAARTKRGYLSDVRTLFNFAVRRGLVTLNAAAGVELPVVECDVAGIHDTRTVTTVLEFARDYDLDVCRSLAVRYFAGLRSSEVARLEEKEIRDGFIEVTAAKAKTRRRRLVTIQPNLTAWLALGGTLPLRDLNNSMRWFTAALKKKHGIDWARNVTRHSFCSYHLARFDNAGKTALEAGHSEQMLFTHYRQIVTPDQALQFWGIVPA